MKELINFLVLNNVTFRVQFEDDEHAHVIISANSFCNWFIEISSIITNEVNIEEFVETKPIYIGDNNELVIVIYFRF